MEQAYGLYTHIRANRLRSIVLLIGLFFLIYVLVFAGALVAEAFRGDASIDQLLAAARRDFIMAFPWATLAAALWILVAYNFRQALIDALTGGYEVTREGQPRLYNLLENLCISRGITMPQLKTMESSALNAFTTGLNKRQYAITATTGLLQTLDDSEVEAVLGHELTHIRNGDVQLMVIAMVITGVISFFGELVFRTPSRSSGSGWGWRSSGSSDRKGSGAALAVILIALALLAIAWFLALVIRSALSRSREFLADAGSVELTKNPDAMITALRKIEGRGELPGANSAVMEMCVDNPREEFADLFATHPSVDSRVDALVRFAGGHDPGPIALATPPEPGADPSPDDTPPQPWGSAPPDPSQTSEELCRILGDGVDQAAW